MAGVTGIALSRHRMALHTGLHLGLGLVNEVLGLEHPPHGEHVTGEAVAHLVEKLSGLMEKLDCVTEVRGKGLLIGLELTDDVSAVSIVTRMLGEGFLVGTAGEKVVRFAPPLIVTPTDIDLLVEALERVLGEAC